MDDQTQNPTLGARLRAHRKAQGLTLQQVAAATGLSIGFLSQVERDIAAPSLSSLVALSAALSAPVSAFLSAPAAPAVNGLTQAATRIPFHVAQGGTGYERLSARFPGSTLRALLVHEPPRPRPEPVRHAGEELLLVLDGALSVEIEGALTVLAQGDSIHFDAGRDHAVWNHATTTAAVLWCGTVDLFDDPPTEAKGTSA